MKRTTCMVCMAKTKLMPKEHGEEATRCAKCLPLSKAQENEILLSRADQMLTNVRAAANEAFKRGDKEALWEMGARIKDLERVKTKIESAPV